MSIDSRQLHALPKFNPADRTRKARHSHLLSMQRRCASAPSNGFSRLTDGAHPNVPERSRSEASAILSARRLVLLASRRRHRRGRALFAARTSARRAVDVPAQNLPQLGAERAASGRLCRHRREGEARGDLGARQGRRRTDARRASTASSPFPPGSPMERFFRASAQPDGDGGPQQRGPRGRATSRIGPGLRLLHLG